MKKLYQLFVLLVLASFVLGACGGQPAAPTTEAPAAPTQAAEKTEAPAPAGKPKIALVTINQQALFFNQVNDGAQKAADAAGAELIIYNANNDPAAQNTAIENYVQQKVDAIIILAIDVNGVKPALQTAKDAGVPVIAVDAVIPDGPQDVQIGVDNKGAGAEIGKYFVDYVNKNMGGKAEVGIVGALNSAIQNLRLDGFTGALTGSAGIQVVATVDGRNIQDNALTAAENLITGNPTMNAVYATGEPALIGAISAVTSQNAMDKVKVFGWDLTAQAIQAIDEGWLVAVVQQDPETEGKVAVESAVKLIAKQPVEKQINVPITIVTKENVDNFRSMFGPAEAKPTQAPAAAEFKASKNWKIAFIPQLIGIPYFTAMENGGNDAAKAFGVTYMNVGSPTASAAEQVRLMENLIQQKVDAISISVLDSASLNPVMERAEQAGIKVYTSDSDSPDSVRRVYVAQSMDQDLGYTLIDRLAAQINNEGKIGIVSGESTATNLNTWIDFMKERVKNNYPKIEIVDVRYTQGGSSEDALRQAEELMTKYPDIKGLVAVASTTVPGVAKAVENAGKIGQVAVIGYGSPNTVRPFIKSGVMKESILWDPRALGYLNVWAGIMLLEGKDFQAENNVPGLKDPVKYFPDTKILLLGPPLVIDANNVDSFDF
jgi:ABC-type sugar transport system substrate-binding protein